METHDSSFVFSCIQQNTNNRKSAAAFMIFIISCDSALLSMLHVLVFFPRSKSAPDMPFRLIDIQHFPGFPGQSRIDLYETFGYVFMYRTLTDPELLRSLSDRSIFFNNIIGDFHRPLFYVAFQENSLIHAFLHCMREFFSL